MATRSAAPFLANQANLEGDDMRSPVSVSPSRQVTGSEQSEWLHIARQSYQASTDYLGANLRTQWARNLNSFHSRHAAGSKYFSQTYKFRSKLFRPKTRTMIRQRQAAVAAAFFATADVVDIQPENDGVPEMIAASKVVHELCNYRLTQQIPWYLTCLGAAQDCDIYGHVISRQDWVFEERDVAVREVGRDEQGNATVNMTRTKQVVKDHPQITLVAPENMRFSPAADWTDPINTSPYLIELIPMFVQDVEAKMRETNPRTGEPRWNQLPRAAILTGQKADEHGVRRAREKERTDSTADHHGEPELYRIVWVHRNIIRREGRDWLYYTLGTHHMLSSPLPLEQVHRQCAITGRRPYTLGTATVEAHKTYPTSITEMAEQLQVLANEIANQRIDNVRLAMNKRYLIRQGQTVDVKALLSSVPGGVVRVTDPKNDIEQIDHQDVTSSSYQEQDRTNVDFDDLVGQFSTGSVQSNRSLNETVGGMNIMSNSANQVNEMDLKTLVETWVEPVLRDLVALEQVYESDPKVLTLAGQKAQVDAWQSMAAVFRGQFVVSVNVGLGATNPTQKVERLVLGLSSVVNLAPQAAGALNVEEVVSEVFGALGYDNGKRFFNLDPNQPGAADPNAQALAAEQQRAQMDAQIKQQELALREREIEINAEIERERLAMDREVKLADLALKYQISLNDIDTQLSTAQMSADSARERAADKPPAADKPKPANKQPAPAE